MACSNPLPLYSESGVGDSIFLKLMCTDILTVGYEQLISNRLSEGQECSFGLHHSGEQAPWVVCCKRSFLLLNQNEQDPFLLLNSKVHSYVWLCKVKKEMQT
jgi:hypothetical protein